jgi:hypothetical protein
MEEQEYVGNSNSVLTGKGGELPECIAEWVLEESGNVFECSPLLGLISWLLGFGNKLSEITVGFLGEGSI